MEYRADGSGFSRTLDRALENAARDVAFLEERRLLSSAERPGRKAPQSFEDAENLARSVCAEAGKPDGPLLDLQSVAESLGCWDFLSHLVPMLVAPHTLRQVQYGSNLNEKRAAARPWFINHHCYFRCAK
ncbi:MAG TPA: hypothetical protein VLG68_02060 [Gammaproteobacteria bacterium]|nr:hypothetical protein [Gammaproteobacteria bacterium]